MTIQQLSADASRMQPYGPAPSKARVPAARPFAQSDTGVVVPSGWKNLDIPVPVLIADNKIPKVEEIRKMIENNGYPYKSSIYKAVTNIVERDLN